MRLQIRNDGLSGAVTTTTSPLKEKKLLMFDSAGSKLPASPWSEAGVPNRGYSYPQGVRDWTSRGTKILGSQSSLYISYRAIYICLFHETHIHAANVLKRRVKLRCENQPGTLYSEKENPYRKIPQGRVFYYLTLVTAKTFWETATIWSKYRHGRTARL